MASKMLLRSVRLLRPTLAIGSCLAAWLLIPGLVRGADEIRFFDKVPSVFDKKSPESVDDLRAIQEHAEKVVKKVMPSVVSVRIDSIFGSGVIISKDGYVLTAGHVSAEPNRDVTIYFQDGKKAKGKTLGGNRIVDSGLIKITTEGDWPYVEMGNSAELRKGDWCMVIAHPGGFKAGRTPPVRLGRILDNKSPTITTDCILVGGDSGGPLFDMHGKVIGINSRIGEKLTQNMHVPVNQFRDGWDKLVASEVIGGKPAWLGIVFIPEAKGCVIKSIAENSPAEKAGLKENDRILKFDGKDIDSGEALATIIRAKSPGARVTLSVQHGDDKRKVVLELGQR